MIDYEQLYYDEKIKVKELERKVNDLEDTLYVMKNKKHVYISKEIVRYFKNKYNVNDEVKK